MKVWSTLAAAAVLSALMGAPISPASAAAPDPCGSGGSAPGQLIRAVPWAQTWLDPDRIRPLASGSGQTIAVIDSGTDGRHPQLAGQVLPGWDALRQAPDNNVDCISHGTAVASLIAARPQPGIGLRGLAPSARILPIRVTDVDPDSSANDPRRPSPAVVAAAITWAAAHGATVIDVSPSFRYDHPRLKAAVASALSAGVVIVAAAGDSPAPRRPQDPPSYPSSYPGVIGVGAVDQTFTPTTTSAAGPEVTVTAPGDRLIAATRQQGYETYSGTSLAAAYVSATAALVRQAWPRLTPSQVRDQIVATADPAASGQRAPGYGHGIVNPYRALTEPIAGAASTSATPVAGLPAPVPDPAAEAQARWWDRVSTTAVIASGTLLAVLILLTAGVVTTVRGRGRRWSPARTLVPARIADPDAPAGSDESDLFALPPSPALRE